MRERERERKRKIDMTIDNRMMDMAVDVEQILEHFRADQQN